MKINFDEPDPQDAEIRLERTILTGLLVSKEFSERIKPIWKDEFFQSPQFKQVAPLIWEYIEKYGVAPNRDIEGIYLDAVAKGVWSKGEAELIKITLTRIAEDYASGQIVIDNLDYLYDQTIAYFDERNLRLHAEKIDAAVTRRNLEEADRLAKGFQPLTGKPSRWVEGSNVTERRVPWVWPLVIARGHVTTFFGKTGDGKSLITEALIAILTTGSPWPVSSNATSPTHVLIVSENPFEEMILPRLKAAEADTARCHYLRRDDEGEFQDHIGTVEKLVHCIEERLDTLPHKGRRSVVVTDTLLSFLQGKDSNTDTHVRPALERLVRMARRRDIAVLTHHHPTKSNHGDVLSLMRGSGAWVEVPRLIHLVVTDPTDTNRILLLWGKSNLGNSHPGYAARKVPVLLRSGGQDISTVRLLWESDVVGLTADQWMAQQRSQSDSRPKLGRAAEWLTEALSNGPVLAKTLFDRVVEEGLSIDTLKRAATEMRVVKSRSGFQGPWMWKLP